MSLEIGPASAGDTHGVAALLIRCMPDCIPLAEEELQASKALFVARDHGQVVGSASRRRSVLGDELRSVAVAPSHRGCGLGAALVQAVVRDAPGPLACVTRHPRFFEPFGFELSPEIAPFRAGPELLAARPRFVMRRDTSRRLHRDVALSDVVRRVPRSSLAAADSSRSAALAPSSQFPTMTENHV